MDLHGCAQACFHTAQEKGFWDDVELGPEMPTNKINEKLLLIHTEISEAVEELRSGQIPGITRYRESDGKPEGLPAELADAVIRVFDLAVALGIDIDRVIDEKMQYNSTRPNKHGREF